MKTKGYIEAKNANYVYGKGMGQFSLNPVNLTLYNGEITFLTGPNGSGKSTLGKLLCGIYKPTKGVVFLEGQDTKTLSLGEIGKKIGYLWQKPEMQIFAPTPLEELCFVEEIEGKEEALRVESAMYWLSLFEIDALKDAPSHTLSRGEKQRLALAAVISRGAGYLILDEPTKGLDSRRKMQFEKLLLRLKESQRVGMLIISHDKSFTSTLADKVLAMKAGGIDDEPFFR